MHPVRTIRASLTTFALRSNRQSASTTTIKAPPSPSFCIPLLNLFSLFSYLRPRVPRLHQLLSLGLSKPLVRHFSNLRSSPTLHCLALSLSFHPYAYCGAVQLCVPQRLLVLLKLASAQVRWPAHFLLSYSLAHCCLSLFSLASSPPSLLLSDASSYRVNGSCS
jgi:hypothetical protein